MHGFNREYLAVGLDDKEHLCLNAQISYLFDKKTGNKLPSKHWLTKNSNTIAERVGNHIDLMKRKGILKDIGYDRILWTANTDLEKVLGRHLSKKGREHDGFVPANARGFNAYQNRDIVLLLATTLLDDQRIESLRELGSRRPRQVLQESLHLENLYQIVFRSVLRSDEAAPVQIICLTSYEAEWLAHKLGTPIPVVQVDPPIKSDKSPGSRSSNAATKR